MVKKKKKRDAKFKARMTAAGKNLERIEKEIAPYTKPRRYEIFSTTGTWTETGSTSSTF